MDSSGFDAVTRRVARSRTRRLGVGRTRRAALGLLGGTLLAAWGVPHGTTASPGGHGDPKGHSKCKDKDEKQKGRKKARTCEAAASARCLHVTTDVFTAAACAAETEACCQFFAACLNQGAKCVAQVFNKYSAH
jgi:hypothetical protein